MGFKDLLKKNDVVKSRWKIKSKLGRGGFGEIYKAYDAKNNETVAVKAEPSNESKQVLPMEVMVLQSIQNRKHAPKFFGCGKTNHCNYLVLELLSRNLTELRRESPCLRFSRGTCFFLTAQAVEALRDLHESGFLHRDIKPSNFTMGLKGNKIRILYLLDYGLARKYVNKKNEVRPPRSKVGFRGTVRYASINTHEGRDMGRHDDLWSLFYSMIEIHKGTLPWRRVPDKDDVVRWKRKMTVEILCQNSPPEMMEFGKLIRRLSYHWTPKYDAMISELRMGMKNANFKWNGPLDWELGFQPAIAEEQVEKKMRTEKEKEATRERKTVTNTQSPNATKAQASGPSFEDPSTN